jgi:hypothetical protein
LRSVVGFLWRFAGISPAGIVAKRRAMSDTAPDPSKTGGKCQEPWSKKAKRHGVVSRTLDRWFIAGVIDPPVYINGRKYAADADEEPRRDDD